MLFMFDAMRSFQSRVVQKCPMAAAFKGAGSGCQALWGNGAGSTPNLIA